MATLKDREFGNYCSRMFDELSLMRTKVLGFAGEIERMKGPDREMLKSHISHFEDIAKMIEWKLEILTRVCPFEWTGYSNVERTASVRLDEELLKRYPSGVGAGDIGG